MAQSLLKALRKMMTLLNHHTSDQLLPTPGMAWGHYPQRRSQAVASPGFVRWSRLIRKSLAALPDPGKQSGQVRLKRFAESCQERIATLMRKDQVTLDLLIRDTRAQISIQGFTDTLALELTALVCEACHRTLGKQAYLVQLMAVRALLDSALAQMQTGEGKTLAVGLAAAIAALAGVPVLVVTANDYLVTRDRELLSPLFETLGLSHDVVVRESTTEQRRASYGSAICYCTAKELGFDYLRDQANQSAQNISINRQTKALLAHEGAPPFEINTLPMLRGLCMAIIDEADSILLDEAVTPLILSKAVKDEAQLRRLNQALQLAKRLWPKTHFTVNGTLRTCQLTEVGQAQLAQWCSQDAVYGEDNVWGHERLREELVLNALSALKVYQIDRDYVIRKGELKMIDQPTGRVAEGRKWSRGIHQLLEMKEGLEASDQTETMAQISYQMLFPRFLRLCGVSGSLLEAKAELKSVYKLNTVNIPLNKPSRRQTFAAQIFANRAQKWKAVLALCQDLHAQGRPILLGTDSVAAARSLGRILRAAKLDHRILTAAQDADEAKIVGQAGERGAITVTTNLAGRGTDIQIDAEVEQLGGLAVISCYLNSERRIDRQLIGRGARQGQCGTSHTLISLDDPLFIKILPIWLDSSLRAWLQKKGATANSKFWRCLVSIAQWIEETRASRQRLQLLENQLSKEKLLAMAGRGE
jgi:preprotein translocase subunit SecA